MLRIKVYILGHQGIQETLVYQVPQEVRSYQEDLSHQADLHDQEVPLEKSNLKMNDV